MAKKPAKPKPKRPLKKIIGYIPDKDFETILLEVLECGHTKVIRTDMYGEETEAVRRRCRKCTNETPVEVDLSGEPHSWDYVKFSRPDVIAKLREYGAQDLGEAELDRVFAPCASPVACKRAVRTMVEKEGLTIEDVVI